MVMFFIKTFLSFLVGKWQWFQQMKKAYFVFTWQQVCVSSLFFFYFLFFLVWFLFFTVNWYWKFGVINNESKKKVQFLLIFALKFENCLNHENTHILSWTRVYKQSQVLHFYLVSKYNYDFNILAHF